MRTLAGSARMRLRELGWAFGLFTRLPLPAAEPPSEAALAGSIWAFPFAGLVIGVASAGAYAAAHFAGLPESLAALAALAASAAMTGAMHEDGLAGFFDGIGGGANVAQKLAIMRDTRLGTYGALALILAVAARWAALGALPSWIAVAVGLVAAHTASRACLTPLFFLLDPVGEEGLGASAGRPKLAPALVGFLLAVLLTLAALPPIAAVTCLAAALLAALLIAWIAKRQLGGYTGDVFGAAEQAAEIGFLWALVVTV